MNKILITEKGLSIIRSLKAEEFHEQISAQPLKLMNQTLPSLKKQKIFKMHQSKKKDYENLQQTVKGKYEHNMENRLSAYVKQEDRFWEKWRQGLAVASNWTAGKEQSYHRYLERVQQCGEIWKKK